MLDDVSLFVGGLAISETGALIHQRQSSFRSVIFWLDNTDKLVSAPGYRKLRVAALRPTESVLRS